MSELQAVLDIDLDQYARNLHVLRTFAPSAQQMAVVKADAYGHGMVPISRAARACGVEWLGVATAAEALQLRAAGDEGSILSWLASPDAADWAHLAELGIDVTASSVRQLDEIVGACSAAGLRPSVQLKVDTGLHRNGAEGEQWTQLVQRAVWLRDRGQVNITGVWSHFANSDLPDHPSNDSQERVFVAAVDEMVAAGLEPGLRHLANSAAIVTRPSAHLDLVRAGISAYGVRPDPDLDVPGIRPILRASARLAQVKQVAAGASVSYGWRWTASEPTWLGLVPLGYGDGIFRSASNRGHVRSADGRDLPVRGVICMDQFVVDLGSEGGRAGDWVVLIGDGARGEPTAEDWAQAGGTIAYEVLTRLQGGRWRRRYSGMTS